MGKRVNKIGEIRWKADGLERKKRKRNKWRADYVQN